MTGLLPSGNAAKVPALNHRAGGGSQPLRPGLSARKLMFPDLMHTAASRSTVLQKIQFSNGVGKDISGIVGREEPEPELCGDHQILDIVPHSARSGQHVLGAECESFVWRRVGASADSVSLGTTVTEGQGSPNHFYWQRSGDTDASNDPGALSLCQDYWTPSSRFLSSAGVAMPVAGNIKSDAVQHGLDCQDPMALLNSQAASIAIDILHPAFLQGETVDSDRSGTPLMGISEQLARLCRASPAVEKVLNRHCWNGSRLGEPVEHQQLIKELTVVKQLAHMQPKPSSKAQVCHSCKALHRHLRELEVAQEKATNNMIIERDILFDRVKKERDEAFQELSRSMDREEMLEKELDVERHQGVDQIEGDPEKELAAERAHVARLQRELTAERSKAATHASLAQTTEESLRQVEGALSVEQSDLQQNELREKELILSREKLEDELATPIRASDDARKAVSIAAGALPRKSTSAIRCDARRSLKADALVRKQSVFALNLQSEDPFLDEVRETLSEIQHVFQQASRAHISSIEAQIAAAIVARDSGKDMKVSARNSLREVDNGCQASAEQVSIAKQRMLALREEMKKQSHLSEADMREIVRTLDICLQLSGEELVQLRGSSAFQDVPEACVLTLCRIHERGFSPNDIWESGFSPMHWAAQNNRRDLLEYFLSRPGGSELLNSRDQQGKTPLAYASALRRQALFHWFRDEADATAPPILPAESIIIRPDMREMPKKYVRLLDQIEADGWAAMDWNNDFTMLHWAAEQGHLCICQYLLKLEADPNAMDNAAQTPMDLAMENSQSHIEEMLQDFAQAPRDPTMKLAWFSLEKLERKSDCLTKAKANKRHTMLGMSSQSNENSSDTSSKPSSRQAIPVAYLKIMDKIDAVGWDLMQWTNGFSLLHWAAKNDMPQLCAQFMWQGADPCSQDDLGNDAFEYATASHAQSALAQLHSGRPENDPRKPMQIGNLGSYEPRKSMMVCARAPGDSQRSSAYGSSASSFQGARGESTKSANTTESSYQFSELRSSVMGESVFEDISGVRDSEDPSRLAPIDLHALPDISSPQSSIAGSSSRSGLRPADNPGASPPRLTQLLGYHVPKRVFNCGLLKT